MAKPEIEHALADAFHITDIFLVNTVMKDAPEESQEAWHRVRAKLIEGGGVKAPTLRVPPWLIAPNGTLYPNPSAE